MKTQRLYTQREIARRLGRSANAIGRKIEKLGIPAAATCATGNLYGKDAIDRLRPEFRKPNRKA